MNKTLLSTVLLFLVFIGFLWWGLSMLTSSIRSTPVDGESIVYGLLILGCAGYALVSILLLPRKRGSSSIEDDTMSENTTSSERSGANPSSSVEPLPQKTEVAP